MALNAWRALYVSAYLFTYCRSDKRVKYLNLYTNNSNVNRQTDRPKENCLHMRVYIVFFFLIWGFRGLGRRLSVVKSFQGLALFPRFSRSLFLFLSISLCFSLQLLLFLTFFAISVVGHAFHTDPLRHRSSSFVKLAGQIAT